MIEPRYPKVSVVRQCSLLKFLRSSFYFQAKGTSPKNLKLMRLIDEQYMETPFFGSRRMRQHLRRLGHRVGRGKGRWMDNVFIERLWRSVKYECVFLHDWALGSEVRAGLQGWLEFYNARRPHQGLKYLTPDEVYAGIEPSDDLKQRSGRSEEKPPVDMMDNAVAHPTYPQDKSNSNENIVVLKEAA